MTAYLGIDPGPSTGITLLEHTDLGWDWHVVQCDAGTAPEITQYFCVTYAPALVAVEKFIVSNGAGAKGKDAEVTRQVIREAERIALAVRRNPACKYCERPAAQVKPWASDKRLARTGFPIGRKFLDARDAGRHALYSAVRDGGERDPLA